MYPVEKYKKTLLVDLLLLRQTDRQTNRQTKDRQTDKRQTDRQTEKRQTDRQTETDRPIHRCTHTHTHMRTHINTHIHTYEHMLLSPNSCICACIACRRAHAQTYKQSHAHTLSLPQSRNSDKQQLNCAG